MEFFARRNGDNFHKRRSCRASSDKKGGAGSAAGSWWTLVTGGRRRGEKEGWKRSVQAEWRAWKKSSCRDGNETFNYVYLTGDDTRRSSRAFFFFFIFAGDNSFAPAECLSSARFSITTRVCIHAWRKVWTCSKTLWTPVNSFPSCTMDRFFPCSRLAKFEEKFYGSLRFISEGRIGIIVERVERSVNGFFFLL